MNSVKSLIVSAALTAASLAPVTGIAQAPMDHSKTGDMKMDMPKDMTDGEIRKVDKDAGKLTIKHSEIKNLGMPPMTMVFQVKEKAMLDKFQAGDKIKFKVVSESGKIVVTEIELGK